MAFPKHIIQKFYLRNDTDRRIGIFLFIPPLSGFGLFVYGPRFLEKKDAAKICRSSAAETAYT
jgi:hypothetical protein